MRRPVAGLLCCVWRHVQCVHVFSHLYSLPGIPGILPLYWQSVYWFTPSAFRNNKTAQCLMSSPAYGPICVLQMWTVGIPYLSSNILSRSSTTDARDWATSHKKKRQGSLVCLAGSGHLHHKYFFHNFLWTKRLWLKRTKSTLCQKARYLPSFWAVAMLSGFLPEKSVKRISATTIFST